METLPNGGGVGAKILKIVEMVPVVPDGFTPWPAGGVCPCPGAIVDVVLSSGDIEYCKPAEAWQWQHGANDGGIRAYRVLSISTAIAVLQAQQLQLIAKIEELVQVTAEQAMKIEELSNRLGQLDNRL